MNCKVKNGNIAITISIPQETNRLIRSHCMKQGDVSRIITEAVESKYANNQTVAAT